MSTESETIEAAKLSKAERIIVARDWPLIDARRDHVAVQLFLRTFDLSRSAQDLFPRFRGLSRDALASLPALRAHGLRVLSVLGAAVRDLADSEEGLIDPEVPKMVGKSHYKLGVKRMHFESMVAALLETLDNELKESNQQNRTAWRKLVHQLLTIVLGQQGILE